MSNSKVAKTAKVSKKETTPKLPMPTKEKGIIKQEAKVRLVSFAVTAVIPTQQYGNIQPRIEVTAPSYEEARAYVMPLVEELWRTYAERPLNGREPRIYGEITVTEKVVDPVFVVGQKAIAPVTTPQVQDTPAPVAVDTPAPQATASAAPQTVEKPESTLKAERAISNATSNDALDTIENQIKNSIKIPEEFKADLLFMLGEKRTSLITF